MKDVRDRGEGGASLDHTVEQIRWAEASSSSAGRLERNERY